MFSRAPKVVNADNLNLRSEPNADGGKAAVLKELPRGTRVYVMRSLENGWDEVVVDPLSSPGQPTAKGYVNDKFLVSERMVSSAPVLSAVTPSPASIAQLPPLVPPPQTAQTFTPPPAEPNPLERTASGISLIFTSVESRFSMMVKSRICMIYAMIINNTKYRIDRVDLSASLVALSISDLGARTREDNHSWRVDSQCANVIQEIQLSPNSFAINTCDARDLAEGDCKDFVHISSVISPSLARMAGQSDAAAETSCRLSHQKKDENFNRWLSCYNRATSRIHSDGTRPSDAEAESVCGALPENPAGSC